MRRVLYWILAVAAACSSSTEPTVACQLDTATGSTKVYFDAYYGCAELRDTLTNTGAEPRTGIRLMIRPSDRWVWLVNGVVQDSGRFDHYSHTTVDDGIALYSDLLPPGAHEKWSAQLTATGLRVSQPRYHDIVYTGAVDIYDFKWAYRAVR